MNRDFFDSNGNVIANPCTGTDEQWDQFLEVIRENINFKDLPFEEQVMLDLQFLTAKVYKILPTWMMLAYINLKPGTGRFKEFERNSKITFDLPPNRTDLLEVKPTEEKNENS